MSILTGVKSRIRDVSIKKKLTVAVTIFGAFTVVAGATGLYFLSDVDSMRVEIAERINPVFENAVELQRAALESKAELIYAMMERSEAAIGAADAALSRSKVATDDGLAAIEALTSDKTTLATARDLTGQFYSEATAMLGALREEATASASRAELLTQVAEADASVLSMLDDFARAAEAAMNVKEDGTRTLVQSGRATRSALEVELTEVLGELYPVLRGAYGLQAIFKLENAAIKAALSSRDPGEIEQQTRKIAGLGRALGREIKKLLPRVSSETATTLRSLSELLAKRAETVSGDLGLLSAHIRAQAALAHASALRANVDDLIVQGDAVLEKILQAAEVQKAASEEGAETAAESAFILVGLVIAIALLLSVLIGIAFIRTFAAPIQGLTGSMPWIPT